MAQGRWTIIRMERGIGEFVIKDAPLISVAGPGQLDDKKTARLNAVYSINRQRTAERDPAFGIRQIVNIALKALSPGIDDSTTAVMCVDYLAAILVRLATRRTTGKDWRAAWRLYKKHSKRSRFCSKRKKRTEADHL